MYLALRPLFALLRGFGEALRLALNVQILCEDTIQQRENQGFNVK